MKTIHAITVVAILLIFQPSCKNAIDDAIDCSFQSSFLAIHDNVDTANTKLVHFEFVNNDTEGSFTLDSNISWDFGDGTSTTTTNFKATHLYAITGSYTVVANYVLRKGSASCNGPKNKTITIN